MADEYSTSKTNFLKKKGRKSMIYLKARRQFQGKKYKIGKIKRRDVLVKATIRKMKKYFYIKFNNITNYLADKKDKTDYFLIEKLQ